MQQSKQSARLYSPERTVGGGGLTAAVEGSGRDQSKGARRGKGARIDLDQMLADNDDGMGLDLPSPMAAGKAPSACGQLLQPVL